MKVEFRERFAKDLRDVKDRALLNRVKQVIGIVEQAQQIDQIPSIKRLRSAGPYYRVRVGDYRIGLVIDGDTATFVRFLHRKDVYRYFP